MSYILLYRYVIGVVIKYIFMKMLFFIKSIAKLIDDLLFM
ncbi:putative membrane protein [Candidatus Neoehrlichia lotoris str. RAC413]|uniref:Putative membrane protein n=1 Tax=Candidatus Neoehrlichia procyonis str. RAC413 TaxID=1359163 RepID=A0A0F3NKX6_9RICK|nr:putative membrane protein [Candidatus Neoehrlichia lotoris str. RAC413]